MDGRDQAILVAADIEDHEAVSAVGGLERLADVAEAFPAGAPRDLVPSLQRRFRLCMPFPELAKLLLGDDVHVSVPKRMISLAIQTWLHLCGAGPMETRGPMSPTWSRA